MKHLRKYESMESDRILEQMQISMGDIMFRNENKDNLSVDNIYIFNRYSNFYLPNRRTFTDVTDFSRSSFMKLERFYEKYPKIVEDAFVEIVDFAGFGTVWNHQCYQIKEVWLKRIPELEFFIQVKKFNL